MSDLGELKKVDARKIWNNEAQDFTPWLCENLQKLGSALGMDLVLEKREADCGDFSLDILAKNLGTGRKVIIENQLDETDHDHFGKLLTYAAGFDASDIIWLSTLIREEHRQALEWLNQNTNSEKSFFGVVVEVLQIDGSKPALNFRPVVFPNKWQKSQRETSSGLVSEKEEKYRRFFQALIDDLREKHKFTGARVGQPQNWYSFSSGHWNFTYSASFAAGGRVRAEVYIDTGDSNETKALFDAVYAKRPEIEQGFGEPLEWERMDNRRASRIAVYRPGSIEEADALDEIKNWAIEKLLKFKKVFGKGLKSV